MRYIDDIIHLRKELTPEEWEDLVEEIEEENSQPQPLDFNDYYIID